MSHRPRKRVKTVAEPTPASKPVPAADNNPAATTNTTEATPTEPLHIPFAALLSESTELLPPLLNKFSAEFPTFVSLLDPDTPALSFVIAAIATRRQLVSLVNILDKCIDEIQPGRTFPCIDRCQLITEPPTPSIPKTFVDKAIDPLPRTYAEVAVGTPAHCDIKPVDPVPSRPTSFSIPRKSRPLGQAQSIVAKNPVRLVVRPTGTSHMQKPFAMLLVAGPSNPYRLLSHALSLSPSTKDVTLLGIHENRSSNLIVSLPCDTPETTIDAIISVIHATFTPTLHFPLLITRDVAWTKLMVSSVKARFNPGAPTYSEEEVKASFLLNPAIQNLKLTRDPRWVRNPASITGHHSSFTFSFQDPDGSIGRGLAKSRLFMFGEPVHLKRWTDKPRQTRGSHAA